MPVGNKRTLSETVADHLDEAERGGEWLHRPSGHCPATIEVAAKIAEPWAGYWLDKSSTDADRAVVAVRTEIAAKIRALATDQVTS
jgi:hypothetical protein